MMFNHRATRAQRPLAISRLATITRCYVRL